MMAVPVAILPNDDWRPEGLAGLRADCQQPAAATCFCFLLTPRPMVRPVVLPPSVDRQQPAWCPALVPNLPRARKRRRKAVRCVPPLLHWAAVAIFCVHHGALASKQRGRKSSGGKLEGWRRHIYEGVKGTVSKQMGEECNSLKEWMRGRK